MDTLKWRYAFSGATLYALAIVFVGLMVWSLDEGRIGNCADLMLSSLLLLISAFAAAVWAGGSESTIGAAVGFFAIVPQAAFAAMVDRFDILGMLVTGIAFVAIGAVGGAIASRVRAT